MKFMMKKKTMAAYLVMHITVPSQILLKLNMLLEIYSDNYDSQDGLTNGLGGIIKAYTKLDKFDVIWIRVHDPSIGRWQAQNFASLCSQRICQDWTPILSTHKKQDIWKLENNL